MIAERTAARVFIKALKPNSEKWYACKEIIFEELKHSQLHNLVSLFKIYEVVVKRRLFLTVALSLFAFSLNACHKPSDTTLTHQYETGVLQWQIARKEIDPNTLIHRAILENASDEIINFLLSHGVNVDYPDQNGMSPLTIAVLNRSTAAVKLLLTNGANPNPAVKWNNMTLLEAAFYMSDWDSAKKLIDHGTNVNGDGGNGWSLLSQVIQKGCGNSDCVEIAKNMINHGANLSGLDVFSAVNSSNLPVLEVLIRKGVDLNKEEHAVPVLIVEAARRGNEDVIKLLAKSGADLNKVERGGQNTALTVAISSGALERVKLLVKLGADVNQNVCRNGMIVSPIKCALEQHSPEIVQYLLQHGARG